MKNINKRIDDLLSNEIDIALRLRAKKILKEVEFSKSKRILDAGCGWGYYLDLLRQIGARNTKVYGVDLDQSSIEKARIKVKGSGIFVKRSDLLTLAFSKNYFDQIILSEVAEHLDNDLGVFKELRRVLKPNGELILTVPNHNYPFFWDPVNWILEHFFGTHIKSGFWAGIWTNHLRLYTSSEILKKLKKAGFKTIEIQPLTRFCLPFNKNLLYGGKLPPTLSKKIMKNIKSARKPIYIKLMLLIVEILDKINSNFSPKKTGVTLFVTAKK